MSATANLPCLCLSSRLGHSRAQRTSQLASPPALDSREKASGWPPLSLPGPTHCLGRPDRPAHSRLESGALRVPSCLHGPPFSFPQRWWSRWSQGLARLICPRWALTSLRPHVASATSFYRSGNRGRGARQEVSGESPGLA